MKESIYRSINGLLVLLFLCFPVDAASQSSDRWSFQLAPYAWLAGQKGTVGTLPGLPAADIDIDFYDDVLGNINGALMLVGEARKGQYGLVMDVAYFDIEDDEATPGPYFSSVNSRTKSWIVSVAGLYRLAETKRAFLDVVGGIRYWSVDSELTLRGGLIGDRGISNKEDWVDPLVGVKGLMPIGESRFFISGMLALGGFGVESDLMWDANINLGYQWTKGFATTFGYRYLDVDYEKDEFLYDVAQSGLVLGLSWRF